MWSASLAPRLFHPDKPGYLWGKELEPREWSALDTGQVAVPLPPPNLHTCTHMPHTRMLAQTPQTCMPTHTQTHKHRHTNTHCHTHAHTHIVSNMHFYITIVTVQPCLLQGFFPSSSRTCILCAYIISSYAVVLYNLLTLSNGHWGSYSGTL